MRAPRARRSEGASLGRAAELSGSGPRAGGALRGPQRPGVARRPAWATHSRIARLDLGRPAPAYSWSHDCPITGRRVLDHAEQTGLGQSRSPTTTSSAARSRRSSRHAAASWLVTRRRGQDDFRARIGLFLDEEIPRGLSFDDTVAAIRDQGGIGYLPPPFDRIHTVPTPPRSRHLAQIDGSSLQRSPSVRDLQRGGAALRAKYGLQMGAGFGRPCAAGRGHGRVRMRAFQGPEEFMLSLRARRSCDSRSLLSSSRSNGRRRAKERVRVTKL